MQPETRHGYEIAQSGHTLVVPAVINMYSIVYSSCWRTALRWAHEWKSNPTWKCDYEQNTINRVYSDICILGHRFFLMFVGQVTQNEAWTSMPALAFSIISAAVAVLMLIGYVLSGRSQKVNGVHHPPAESGK